MARAFLVSCFLHHTRLNDALGTTLWIDEESPEGVVRGAVVQTKDGLPLQLYAPAEGWLGPLG